MQPTLCSRCHKNVAVIFIQKMEGGTTKSEGLCLKCAKELGIKPVEDMMQKMGISDEDLEGLTNEMMSAFGGAEGAEGLVPQDGEGIRERPPKGEVKNSVGAGDSMVAGFLAGWLNTGDYAQALRLGAAAGSATAFSDGLASRAAVEELFRQEFPQA